MRFWNANEINSLKMETDALLISHKLLRKLVSDKKQENRVDKAWKYIYEIYSALKSSNCVSVFVFSYLPVSTQ